MATPTLSVPTLRKEVRDYILACEQLLSPTTFTAEEPLSADERNVMEYFMNELKTYLIVP